MDRKDSLIASLRKKGEEGMSSKAIAKKFGYSRTDSSSKMIFLLRRDGYNIEYNTERQVYVLIEKADEEPSEETDEVTEVTSEETPEVDHTGEDTPEEEEDAQIIDTGRPGNKRTAVLSVLLKNGKEGATPKELAKRAKLRVANICYHIHALRKKDGLKIENIDGKYYLKSRKIRLNGKAVSPSSNGSAEPLTDEDQLIELINDKELVRGLKIIQPEDLPYYLDLIKKVIYHRQAALSLVKTAELLTKLDPSKILI